MREVLEVGARGFVLKSDAARDLVAAVEALQRRRYVLYPQRSTQRLCFTDF